MKHRTRNIRRVAALTGAITVATGVLAMPGTALAKKTTIIETTPQGYTMTLKVKGKEGKLRISCPSGSSLGAAKFKLRGRNFTASNNSWTFSGKVDKPHHFKGSGSTKGPKCGAGVSASFSEPVPTTAVWTVCPSNDVLNPIAAGTPLTFKGVLAGAALGTQLRIEYTDPGPAITDVVHVTTDASGNFSDTHAFPASGGSEYGADATARYPDQSLATGVSCGLFIQ
jgi:hypothetical protein